VFAGSTFDCFADGYNKLIGSAAFHKLYLVFEFELVLLIYISQKLCYQTVLCTKKYFNFTLVLVKQ
jgi:hypothetical protein